MNQKVSPLKLLFFTIFITGSFFWFWLIIAKSLNISLVGASLADFKILALPIIPLIIAVSLLTIFFILQDVPSWLRILISFLIGAPIFFVSRPPSGLAAIACLILILSTIWITEKLKTEAEDHLRVRIFHLAWGSIPLLLTLIILAITLLIVADLKPNISQKGLTIPKEIIHKNSPILRLVPGFENITINQPEEITLIAKQLKVDYQRQDTVYDLVRKNLEQRLNKIFKGSTSLILWSIGSLIFISLMILRLPIMMIISLITYFLYLIFVSVHFIEIRESNVEAHLPFLAKKSEE